ncbi:MAG TPA: tRNA-dihydrouridine synthase [Alphaproteobacteria bacterium]|nr:tRNA-dihydrouridine synthase [Alphaproteobacteria bacterium]
MGDASRLAVKIGGIRLKNPVICGAGEHLIEAAGIEAALAAGAAAVVMKSTNESDAAKTQLAQADYVLLDSDWRALDWDGAPPRGAHLFCRSGLSPLAFDDWLKLLKESDERARHHDALVVASLIPGDPGAALDYARAMEGAGARVIELNIGAPHAGEAAAGAITHARDTERVRTMTEQMRAAVTVPLWVKLTGQSDDVAGLVVAAREGGADAVTVMGRFMGFVPDVESQGPMLGTFGAIGGAWALPLTCRWLALARRAVGPDFPLLATNGARDGLDVVRFLLAGARGVQMTTAVMTAGFDVVAQTIAAVADYLAARGQGADDLVGRAADALTGYQEAGGEDHRWRELFAAVDRSNGP